MPRSILSILDIKVNLGSLSILQLRKLKLRDLSRLLKLTANKVEGSEQI